MSLFIYLSSGHAGQSDLKKEKRTDLLQCYQYSVSLHIKLKRNTVPSNTDIDDVMHLTNLRCTCVHTVISDMFEHCICVRLGVMWTYVMLIRCCYGTATRTILFDVCISVRGICYDHCSPRLVPAVPLSVGLSSVQCLRFCQTRRVLEMCNELWSFPCEHLVRFIRDAWVKKKRITVRLRCLRF